MNIYSKTRTKSAEILNLKGKEIPYTLIVSGRARRLSLKIGEQSGLEVVVPKRYSLKQVPRFIHEKEDWIISNLNKVEEKKLMKPKFEDGITINIIEIPTTIRINLTKRKRSYIKEATALKFAADHAYYDGKEILIYCNGTIEEAKKLLEKHLRKEAKKHFQKRTSQIAEQMDLIFNRITIKGQKTRWGSCSRDKNLNFNWRLILTTHEIIDSIIIHELAHTKHLNHGKHFYSLVEKYCPNHKSLSKQLRTKNFAI